MIPTAKTQRTFLSTPSARRATRNAKATWLCDAAFLSTPSARRATLLHYSPGHRRFISIHALREEGDPEWSQTFHPQFDFYPRPPRGGRLTAPFQQADAELFLSTPSARRATAAARRNLVALGISIHALREEGDGRACCFQPASSYFYPRPPRGGRRLHIAGDPVGMVISIHALREEGDRGRQSCRPGGGYFYPRPPRGGRLGRIEAPNTNHEFLSTPSARRATRAAP